MRAAMIHYRTRAAIRGRGFTIVELLVTMAVVAILIGLLVPGMGMVRRASLETRCLANLRTMATALHSYFNTSNEQYPISSHTTGDVSRADAWMQALAAHGFDGAVRICPADPYGEERVTRYAINTYFEPLVPGIDFDPFTQQILAGGRSSAVSRLPQIPAPDRTFWAMETEGAGLIDHVHSVGWTSVDQIKTTIAVLRHGEGCNVLFADGHAAGVTWLRLANDFEAGRNPFNPETPY